jgi:predicted RecB family nuclease
MASPFASWMGCLALEYPDRSPEPDPADELGGVLQQRGLQHEAHQLQQFREQGFTVADLSEQALGSNSFPLRQQATLEAMRAGYGIIYQAALEQSPFRGYVDFLVKVPGYSQLGDYHYEVWDTKLSLKVTEHPRSRDTFGTFKIVSHQSHLQLHQLMHCQHEGLDTKLTPMKGGKKFTFIRATFR